MLLTLEKTLYLTTMSSVYFEEAGHKLLRIPLEYGQEIKVCNMLLECCSQQQTYFNCNALLAERFCLLKSPLQQFQAMFCNKLLRHSSFGDL